MAAPADGDVRVLARSGWQLPALQVRYSGFFMWEVQEKMLSLVSCLLTLWFYDWSKLGCG